MKAFTDISQSKKLAEILPMESADMYYCYGMNIDTKIWSFDNTPTIIDADNQVDVDDIPCWSLAALLDVLPKHIGDSVLRMDMSENDFNLWFDDLSGIVDILLPDITKDNPIDACYEMVLKLHEQNFL